MRSFSLVIFLLLAGYCSVAQPSLNKFNLPERINGKEVWRFAVDTVKLNLKHEKRKDESKKIDDKRKIDSRQIFYWNRELKRAQRDTILNFNFWDTDSLVKNTSLTGLFNSTSGSLATEWLVDGFGLWRMSVGSALTIAKDSAVKDFQTFMNGGGNFFVKAATPLFILANRKQPSKRYLCAYFSPKIGAIIPGLGQSQSDSLTWNVDAAVELHAKIAGNEEKIAVFSVLRSGFSVGSKKFVENITSNQRRSFGYGIATVGFILSKKFVLQMNFPLSFIGNINDPIDKVPASISLAFLNDN